MSNASCSSCSGTGWISCSAPGYSTAGYRREDIRADKYGLAEVRCDDCNGSGERCHCDVCGTTTRQADPLFGEDGECLWCALEALDAVRRAS